LGEGRRVVIGLRDTPVSSSNPYSINERTRMFRDLFAERIQIISIPEDGSLELVRGRNVGWDIRDISVEPELERLSASSIRAGNPKVKGQTLWFIGLPASGKTTLAGKVVRECVGYVLLDGDEVRQTVENFDMGDNARLVHLSYMAFCCQQLNRCGVNVAAAFVTPLEKHRERIRQILPEVKFIWLECAPETCATRDPKGLWKKAARGELSHLTGAGGLWENPAGNVFALRTDVFPVEEAFAQIKKQFGLVPSGRPA
jgi:adenylylsulfate kinase-like enzyme